MEDKLMIVGYARISSEEQAIDANALVKQINRLRDAGAVKIFYDVAQIGRAHV